MSGKHGTVPERFWPKVQNVGAVGCWEWSGARDPNGYGRFRDSDGQSVLAHRMSWRLVNGDAGDLFVCHSCDNPPCVNPAHLWLGTAADNMRDSSEKGRMGGVCKQGHVMTPENTYRKGENGGTACRACQIAWARNRRLNVKRGEEPLRDDLLTKRLEKSVEMTQREPINA